MKRFWANIIGSRVDNPNTNFSALNINSDQTSQKPTPASAYEDSDMSGSTSPTPNNSGSVKNITATVKLSAKEAIQNYLEEILEKNIDVSVANSIEFKIIASLLFTFTDDLQTLVNDRAIELSPEDKKYLDLHLILSKCNLSEYQFFLTEINKLIYNYNKLAKKEPSAKEKFGYFLQRAEQLYSKPSPEIKSQPNYELIQQHYSKIADNFINYSNLLNAVKNLVTLDNNNGSDKLLTTEMKRLLTMKWVALATFSLNEKWLFDSSKFITDDEKKLIETQNQTTKLLVLETLQIPVEVPTANSENKSKITMEIFSKFKDKSEQLHRQVLKLDENEDVVSNFNYKT